jgi:hypothetical protein
VKLYHGTGLKAARQILRDGILPRAKTRRSNWKKAPSGADRVYLTDSYPLYFAINALEGRDDAPCVIEVNAEALPWLNGVADEDVLEQVGRGKDGLNPEWDMIRRTRHYRDSAHAHAAEGRDMEWSLDAMGTCAIIDGVPPEAITRIAHLPVAHPATMAAADASISLLNFRFAGGGHRMLSQWLFDPATLPPIPPEIKALDLRSAEGIVKAMGTIIERGLCDVMNGEERMMMFLWQANREGIVVEQARQATRS